MRYGKIPVFEQSGATRKTSFSSRKGRTASQHTENCMSPRRVYDPGNQFPKLDSVRKATKSEKKPLESCKYSQSKFDSKKLKTLIKKIQLQKPVVQVVITLHGR